MLDSLVLRDMLVAVSVVNETKVSDGAGLPRIGVCCSCMIWDV